MSKKTLEIETDKYTVRMGSDGLVEFTVKTAADPKPIISLDVVAFDDLVKQRKAIMN